MSLTENEARALRGVDLSMDIPVRLVPGRRFLDIKYYNYDNDTEEEIRKWKLRAISMQDSDCIMITNVIAGSSPFSAFDDAKNLVMLTTVGENGRKINSMWVPIHWVYHPGKHRTLMHRMQPLNRKHEPL